MGGRRAPGVAEISFDTSRNFLLRCAAFQIIDEERRSGAGV